MNCPTSNPVHGRVAFDATVNLGHVLTIVAICVSAAGAWFGMDKRMSLMEASLAAEKARSALVEVATQKALSDMATDMREIRRYLTERSEPQIKRQPLPRSPM